MGYSGTSNNGKMELMPYFLITHTPTKCVGYRSGSTPLWAEDEETARIAFWKQYPNDPIHSVKFLFEDGFNKSGNEL